ncbi:MAG TPA: transaldolase [Acidimicrobiia bacterium]|jgi:transaldolase/transaldolase/glucose-6-phosphate isomerase
MTKLHDLHAVGQSAWLDFITRNLLDGGGLERMVESGIRGVTSNPTIFQKAITGSDDYDDAIGAALAESPDMSASEMFERLAIADIRRATDVLRPVYDSSSGADGFVSLEVSPHLAMDTEATVAEATRLWETVDRPNLMVKVPATAPGIPAVEELLARGLNINITLMFSLADYEAVAHAYLRGLARAANPASISSVASFFVSRVDTLTDEMLDKIGTDEALALRGKAAVANAKLAYRRYREIFEGESFATLASEGARPQRVLWASTSTKNPAYHDTMYVDELIGANTVNTMPPATIDAFEDHGIIDAAAMTRDVDEAQAMVAALADVGVDYDEMTAQLQAEGVAAFADSYDSLVSAIGDVIAERRS